MKVIENQDLKSHSTMQLGGAARYFTGVSTRAELTEAISWADEKNVPIIMIGGGSNVIWKDEGFAGLVIENNILGYELQEMSEDEAMLVLGAGENWDQVVAKTVEAGYFTLAPLSLIPGRVGATPIQNVGAYGQEVSNSITTIQAYDTKEKTYVNLRSSECDFGYRTSRFKTTDKNRFFIVSVTFTLSKQNTFKPYYETLQMYANERKINIETPAQLRQAVIDVRTSRLPDPATVPNNGSFFANPIITKQELTTITANHPDIRYWNLEDGNVKVSAAWLVDKAGFKDFHDKETGMATWMAQPLVIINEHATSTASLLKFRQKIIDKVQQTFGITLEQEPEILP